MVRKLSKLGSKILSLVDTNFIEDVTDDLKTFLSCPNHDRVLLFPPVSNYRRFLIHQSVNDLNTPELSTFSIGVGAERRTVVCFKELLLSDTACAKPATMGLSQTDRDEEITPFTGAAEGESGARAQEKIRPASTKPRRPDRAVYVPRALRGEQAKDTRKRPIQTTPTNPKKTTIQETEKEEKSTPNTPRRDKKAFCNVYTPPPLRNQKIEESQHEYPETNDQEPEETFYIGNYFSSGQLGLYNPYYDYPIDINSRVDCKVYSDINELDMSLTSNDSNVINNYGLINYRKGEDEEKEEFVRASQEINRGNKRIIKQSFHSDVLVISDPVEEEVNEPKVVAEAKKVVKEKPKLEAKVSIKREENDWDAVFDESGECLDPSLLEELSATVGKVHITKAKNNYEQYQTKGQTLFSGPIDESLAHVVEVYDFPCEFKTNDLLSVFSEYKETGFEIKWVDDTHALIVFSSSKIAAEVLMNQHPLVKCRPLHAATQESRNKAKKCAEFLQPYRQRPETCAALARRLVSGALGVKLSTARQERAEERRIITIAREKKRQAALHKEAAWDGSLGSQSVAET